MALGVALVSFAGCGHGGSSSGGGSVVATVNGTPITQDEFLRYLMLKPTVEVRSNKGAVEAPVAFPLGFQALNDLVKQKLVVQMAKQEGVYPTDADIAKEIQFRLDGDPNFVKNLNSQGLDMQMIKDALAVEMARDNMIGKGITVTDADIDQFKKDHPQDFMQPAMLNLQWILVKTPEAKKEVDDQLSRGQPFDQVAMQLSVVQNAKESHGAYPNSIESQIPKEILDVTKNIQPLHASDWLPGSNNSGYAKFYVVSRTPAKPVEMTDHVKELVRRQIKSIRGSSARDVGSEIVSQQKSSTINVNMPGLQDPWNAYVKQIAAQPSGSLGTGVPGATAPATTGGAPAATTTAAAPSTKGGK